MDLVWRNALAVLLAALLLEISSQACSADPLFKEVPIYFNLQAHASSGNFVPPNELEPQKARPILKTAGPGIYVSVGTERSFLGFSQAKRADFLLMLDRDPMVVLFNRINVALLKMSTSLKDYLGLRHAQDVNAWSSHPNWSKLSISERELLTGKVCDLCIPNFQYWSEILQNYKFVALDKISSSSQHIVGGYTIAPFTKDNYLRDEDSFNRLSQAAKDGRMVALQIDLTNQQAVSRVLQSIQSVDMKISVLDLSNVWDYWYDDAFANFLRDFGAVARKGSIILSTIDYLGKPFPRWSYVGVTFHHLLTHPKLDLPDRLYRILKERLRNKRVVPRSLWIGQAAAPCIDELED